MIIAILGAYGHAQSPTLSDLFGGGVITAGDKEFTDWSLVDDFGTVTPDFSLIAVDAFTAGSTVGLRYSGSGELATVGDQDAIAFSFSFRVATAGGQTTIAGADLEISAASGFGAGPLIAITETATAGALVADNLVEIDPAFGVVTLLDSASFAPQSALDVTTGVSLFGTGPGDTATLDSFEQRFIQVPEPAAAVLLIGGLACLILRTSRSHAAEGRADRSA